MTIRDKLIKDMSDKQFVSHLDLRGVVSFLPVIDMINISILRGLTITVNQPYIFSPQYEQRRRTQEA